MYKNKIIISALIILALAFLVVIVLSHLSSGNKNGDVFPTPSPLIQGGESEAKPGVENTSQDEEKNRRSFLVGQLINQIPYNGASFSLYYNFSKNEFILYINPSTPSQGNVEFDAFLKKNGVESRSWIENLVSTSEKLTPAP